MPLILETPNSRELLICFGLPDSEPFRKSDLTFQSGGKRGSFLGPGCVGFCQRNPQAGHRTIPPSYYPGHARRKSSLDYIQP